MLYDILSKYELFFDGTLGTLKPKPVDIEPHPVSKPYHSKPYPVPSAHEDVFKTELKIIFQIGLLKIGE